MPEYMHSFAAVVMLSFLLQPALFVAVFNIYWMVP